GTLRKIYGMGFAAGYPATEKLSDVLQQLNETSLSQLRRDHATGHLEHKITNALKYVSAWRRFCSQCKTCRRGRCRRFGTSPAAWTFAGFQSIASPARGLKITGRCACCPRAMPMPTLRRALRSMSRGPCAAITI